MAAATNGAGHGATTDHQVHFINTDSGLAPMAAAFDAARLIAVDTETYGFTHYPTFEGTMRVLSAAAIDRDDNITIWVVDARDVSRAALAAVLTGRKFLGWNANFDDQVITRDVFDGDHFAAPKWGDVGVVESLLNPGLKRFLGLAEASDIYLDEEMSGKGTTQTSFDATTDLTDEQIRYAGDDADKTLRVFLKVWEQIQRNGLVQAARLELKRLPYLNDMYQAGWILDWTLWEQVGLVPARERQGEALAKLAALTGGGQFNLFTAGEEPNWKPGSDVEVRKVLNKWAEAEVRAYLTEWEGENRLLRPGDSVGAVELKLIGHPITDALIEYREAGTILTNFGEGEVKTKANGKVALKGLRPHIHPVTGRVHSRYNSGGQGTGTGRLSSTPNAQNSPPVLKHAQVPQSGHVFIHGDWSQAEPRVKAQLFRDPARLRIYREGLDGHTLTAAEMFGVDMEELRETDPKQFKEFRQGGKYGQLATDYGTGSKSLAKQISAAGTPTTAKEASELHRAYKGVFTVETAAFEARDAEVEQIAKSMPLPDADATLRLLDLLAAIRGEEQAAKERSRDRLSASEIAERLDTASPDQGWLDRVDEIRWARKFPAPWMLVNGEVWQFAARTQSGRARFFRVRTGSAGSSSRNGKSNDLLMSMVKELCYDRTDGTAKFVDQWAADNGIQIRRNGRALSMRELEKAFEDGSRPLRRMLVDAARAHLGEANFAKLMRAGAQDQVRGMRNQYRNCIIQGEVADAGARCDARLYDELQRFGGQVRPVLCVHDSYVLTCPKEMADDVARILKEVMEWALAQSCPDVPVVADVDVRTTMHSDSVLYELDATAAPAAA